MKHLTKISLAIIYLIVNGLALTSAAQNVFTYNVHTTADELTIVATDEGMKYIFDEINFTQIEGAPEIPYKVINLALPAYTEIVSIEAAGTQLCSIGRGIDMAWFKGDIKTDIYESYEPAPKNQEIYESTNLFPGKYAELLQSGHMGKQYLASLAVYPVQYRPADGEIILAGDIEIRINLRDVPMPASYNNNAGDPSLSEFVDNPQDLPLMHSAATSGDGPMPCGTVLGLGAEYLVITSAELAPAFYPFVVWKNQKGLLTELVLIEDILARYSGADDAERLREYLKDAYNEGAQWVLLGGDEDIIPIRYAYPGNVSSPPALRYQQVCDLYYADLTGDWDVDGDGIYGEYTNDAPDIFPEVYVGRLPAESPEDIEAWVSKLIAYEQNPNDGDYSYLLKGLFITADQMRDLNEHTQLAALMPDNFDIDYSRLAEEPSGGSDSPTQPTGERVAEVMEEGWGFISNLNHGGFYYYAAMTPGYNGSPRSCFFGDTMYVENNNACIADMPESQKFGVHYTISCYTAAYDFDKEIFWPGPFITNNSFMEAYLFLPNKGGVAFLGNTRWGWVSSSFQLEKKFIEYVFSDTARSIAVAEALSKIYYPTKRDIGYGHSVFGDPEMKIWAQIPTPLHVQAPQEISVDTNMITVNVADATGPISAAKVTIWKPGELYLRGFTDSQGQLEVPISLSNAGEMYITAISDDYLPDIDTVNVHLQSAAEEPDALPDKTYLAANYPNPFNAQTNIHFTLATNSHVTLEIYDIGGRKVKTVINDDLAVGNNAVIWNGTNDLGKPVASGTYFYRLKTGTDDLIKKMVLLK